MRALLGTGRRDVPVGFAEVDQPKPGPGEALVKVEAFSVNRGETFQLEAPRPGWRPGKDIAGLVVQAAADGSGPAVCRRVVGHPPAGGWAEYVAVPTSSLAELPDTRIVARALDALDADAGLDLDRVAVIGLSLGGHHAAKAAAHEPRVRAAALVSGPYRLDWDGLVPFVTATLAQRCGGLDAARAFARRIDLTALAPTITTPLLVVEGGQDGIPGVTPATALAEHAPDAELLLVPHGNHLLGTALADWLPATADWLATRLAADGTPGDRG
ncbi:alcohol dehydrogenase catalytic domain-containing protein [Kitasatospora sp. NPDC101176]|uniref:alcohol dehydrogenase catalytic domain-containing protein n=1 Tax=Kitasatospora sp. NPDC101176 TaxID=3364099 RepID=UPI003801C73E